MNITEDYISYKVAKLLKEKGFDWECEHVIWEGADDNYENYDKAIPNPTHQMAMKWLREVRSIAIEPMLLSNGWFCQIERILDNFCKEYIAETDSYNTYEEAAEAALKYSLEKI